MDDGRDSRGRLLGLRGLGFLSFLARLIVRFKNRASGSDKSGGFVFSGRAASQVWGGDFSCIGGPNDRSD